MVEVTKRSFGKLVLCGVSVLQQKQESFSQGPDALSKRVNKKADVNRERRAVLVPIVFSQTLFFVRS